MSKKGVLFLVLIIIAAYIIIVVKPFDQTIIEDEQIEVKLYFSTKDAMYLQAEPRQINQDRLYENTLSELIKGPESDNLSRTIPDGVEIKGIRLEEEIAYLDFNQALVSNHWGGSTGETLTVYSIVNTMVQFPDIRQVQILIEGEAVETLVGHLYLQKPLNPDEKLIKETE
jgi:spore germination protein GerM